MPQEVYEKVAWVSSQICKLELNIGSIDHAIVHIRHVLNCGHEAAVTDGMWAASNLLNLDNAGVVSRKMILADQHMLDIAIHHMGRTALLQSAPATRMIGNIFKGSDAVIFERSIACGYFASLLKLLNTATDEVKKEGLWGLSNLVADNHQTAQAFIMQQNLLKKIFSMMQQQSYNIRGEAAWVLSNAITVATKENNK